MNSLLLTSLLLACVACGGEEPVQPLEAEAEEQSWTHFVQPLSLTPGCYVPPPHQPVPEGVSDALARQAERDLTWRQSRALGCLDRYRQVTTLIQEEPDAREWEIEHDGIQFSIEGSSHQGPDEGYFAVKVLDAPEESVTSCAAGKLSVGTYTEKQSYVDRSGVSMIWNKNTVSAVLPLGGYNIMLYHRGCDPETNISFGMLVPYDALGTSTRCWNQASEFVDCEEAGVNTWPYEPISDSEE